MSEKNYYKCTIKTEYEDNKGRMKVKKENYVVEAVNPTDVEAKMEKHLKITDFEVVAISLMNIIEIVK